jgi:HEAT repeat protein
MRRQILILMALLLLLPACQKQGTLDLDGLAGQARGGDAAACRELVALLATPDTALGDRIYAMVIQVGEPLIPALLAQLTTTNADQRERVAAALGNLKAAQAVPGLVAILADSNLKRRYIAAWALGEIGAAEGITPLIAALDDDNDQVRRHATRSLIKFNQSAVLPLLTALSGANQRPAAGIVRVLGDIGDRRALEPLLQRVDGEIRGEVFLALGKLRDPRAESALITGLADSDWQVRMNAAMALGPIGTPKSIPPLTVTLDDDVMVVREWSARSLSMLTGHEVEYRDATGVLVAPYNVYH